MSGITEISSPPTRIGLAPDPTNSNAGYVCLRLPLTGWSEYCYVFRIRLRMFAGSGHDTGPRGQLGNLQVVTKYFADSTIDVQDFVECIPSSSIARKIAW